MQASKVKRPNGRAEMIKALLQRGIISKNQAKIRVLRQDKADKAQLAKSCTRETRCCTFSRAFRGVSDAAVLKDSISDMVVKMTDLVHQRGFLVWLVLHRLIVEKLPFPRLRGGGLLNFVRRCLVVGTPGSLSDKKAEVILETIKLNKRLFPALRRPDDMSGNVVTHAARIYKTAFERHFTDLETVVARIKRVASTLLFDPYVRSLKVDEEDADPEDRLPAKKEVGHQPLENILLALQDPEFDRRVMHPRQLEVLEKISGMLGLAEVTKKERLSQAWLKQNVEKSIRFCLAAAKHLDSVAEESSRLQKRIEEEFVRDPTKDKLKLKRGFVKGIRFVPLNNDDRRFVTIDATTISSLLLRSKASDSKPVSDALLLPEDDDEEEDDDVPQDPIAVEIARDLFAKNLKDIFGKYYVSREEDVVDGPDRHKYRVFTGTIVTDAATTFYAQFDRPLRPEEIAKKEAKKAKPRVLGEEKPLVVKRKEKEKVEKLKEIPKFVLLVDPGQVSIATIAAILDGKPVMIPKGVVEGRFKPLIYKMSRNRYYTETGVVKNRAIRSRKLRKKAPVKKLNDKLSGTSLRTGDVDKIKAYMAALIDEKEGRDMHRAERLSKKTSASRHRTRVAKSKVLYKFFSAIKRDIFARFGVKEVLVVWGSAKFASGGIGSPCVPTSKAFEIASKIPGWKVVFSSEYKSSKIACISPHNENLAPRFSGLEKTVERKRSVRFEARLRAGYVVGLRAKRSLVRTDYKRLREMKKVKFRTKIEWTLDGHSGESKEVKALKKAERARLNRKCKYARGLRICPDVVYKIIVDRDYNGCIGIGVIWISNNVEGFELPEPYKRKSGSSTTVQQQEEEKQ